MGTPLRPPHPGQHYGLPPLGRPGLPPGFALKKSRRTGQSGTPVCLFFHGGFFAIPLPSFPRKRESRNARQDLKIPCPVFSTRVGLLKSSLAEATAKPGSQWEPSGISLRVRAISPCSNLCQRVLRIPLARYYQQALAYLNPDLSWLRQGQGADTKPAELSRRGKAISPVLTYANAY